MPMAAVIKSVSLSLSALRCAYEGPARVQLSGADKKAIQAAQATVKKVLREGSTVYGINTGFGLLANTKIPPGQLEDLQRNLVFSHMAGVGKHLPDNVVRLVLVLKILSLSKGYSGVRLELVSALQKLLEAEVYPCIPEKGSVGASGDLAPLAHLSGVLLGLGTVRYKGKEISATEGLKKANLKPMTLAPKEGLALLNGTQVSTALALAGLFKIENVFASAVVSGAMSVDAAMGSHVPFDAQIARVRGQVGQVKVAGFYRRLLAESEICKSHIDCDKVQDPYCLRCQPQVMGAVLDIINYAATILLREASAVSDNPLIFPTSGKILSGGNFHAEPIAFAADILALAVAEIGSMSERRVAMLVDAKLSGLPAFLVKNSGVNSGFMIAQVTAAALVAENKQMAHPASVDSIPTSANQEDHVSMATHAARRLLEMAENAANVVAIEFLAAAQGLDFHKPLVSSKILVDVHAIIRKKVRFYSKDRPLNKDIANITGLIKDGAFQAHVIAALPSGG